MGDQKLPYVGASAIILLSPCVTTGCALPAVLRSTQGPAGREAAATSSGYAGEAMGSPSSHCPALISGLPSVPRLQPSLPPTRGKSGVHLLVHGPEVRLCHIVRKAGS
jgi:hypothetical protein